MLARLMIFVAALTGPATGTFSGPVDLSVSLNANGEVDLAAVVHEIGRATGLQVPPAAKTRLLPMTGLSGALTRTMLKERLGSDFALEVKDGTVHLTLPGGKLSRDALKRRLDNLSAQIERESRRDGRYGLHAAASYRPNDPARPTVVLIHGINSSSGSFVHMIEPLQDAGFGVLLYDFPFNRDLAESVRRFSEDWKKFRRDAEERAPWTIVTHSMGALIGRAYVEGESYENDVSDLVLIGPPNHGAAVAKAQTLLQLVEGLQSVKGRQGNALAGLSEGLGEAADDLAPNSPFLRALNARPRREGVRYHILAGSAGFLSKSARGQVEAQYAAVSRSSGFLGGLARVVLRDLDAQLDELTDGLGDGCVSIASTRLAGVTDHQVIHVNHVELIRGPLLFPDPGPVAGMPFILRSLGKGPATDRSR